MTQVPQVDPRTRLRIPALLMLGAMLGGCAVLTIDVDVYKGPLANDEEVQLEQVAVMAIGAKPLLIQLRDRLEVRYLQTKQAKDSASTYNDKIGKLLESFRTDNKWYEAAYIPPYFHKDEGRWRERFNDDRAIQVNLVLGLYEETGDPRLAKFITVGWKEYRELNTAVQTFRPKNEDERIREEFAPSFVPEVAGKSFPLLELPECPPPTSRLLTLRRAYDRFLFPLETDGKLRRNGAIRILQAHHCLLSDPAIAERAMPLPKLDGGPLENLFRDRDEKVREEARRQFSSNSLYRALQDRRLIELHASLLFKPSSENERNEFVKRVTALADSHAQGREAIRNFWLLSLQFISLVNAPGFKDLPNRKEIVERTARFASSLTHPTYLTVALHGDAPTTQVQWLKGELIDRDALDKPELGKKLLIKDGEGWLEAKVAQRLRDRLTALLVREPERTTRALIETALFFADEKRVFPGRFQSPERRRYGIVRSLREPFEEERADYETPLVEAVEALRILRGAFEGGRLPIGLETAIEDYLAEARRLVPDRNVLKQKSQLLLDDLVRFAQKVLFVGNLSYLVTAAEVREYVFLLQAVGNSILTQVDELKRLARRAREQIGRATTERMIRGDIWEKRFKEQRIKRISPTGQPLQPSGPPSPGPASQPAKATATNAPDPTEEKLELDPAIAELRYLYLQALTGGLAEAKALQDAIREAYEQRSRMIYLRPAAAFLRNSYPVTSLQRDSKAIWTNLLSEHALRQLGIDPGVGDDSARKAIQEFDKQFWQNVNTVRVAGAGLTSYVVVKDDVGNWYVKNFTSDPETIIKAAKSMALFAAGGSIGADAIHSATEKLKGKVPGPAPGNGGATQLLEKQRQVAAKKDKDDTKILLTNLRATEDPKVLKMRIEREWVRQTIQDPERLELLGVAVEASRDNCRARTDTQPAEQERELQNELKNLKECRDRIISNLDGNLLQREINGRASQVLNEAQPAAEKAGKANEAATKAKDEAQAAFSKANELQPIAEELAKKYATIQDLTTDAAKTASKEAADLAKQAAARADEAEKLAIRADETAKEAMAKVTEMNAAAETVEAEAKKVSVKVADSQTAAGKASDAKTAANAAVAVINTSLAKAREAKNAAEKAANDAKAARDKIEAAAPDAKPATTTAQTSAKTALEAARGFQEAAAKAQKTTADAATKVGAAWAAAQKTAQPPVQLSKSDLEKATKGVNIAFEKLGVGFIERREGIIKEHSTRLKAILGESLD